MGYGGTILIPRSPHGGLIPIPTIFPTLSYVEKQFKTRARRCTPIDIYVYMESILCNFTCLTDLHNYFLLIRRGRIKIGLYFSLHKILSCNMTEEVVEN
jgi:hypothetical protein